MYFQPYDWHEGDIAGSFVIRVWAHTPESERICVTVRDYMPRMLFALPTNMDIDWLRASVKAEISEQLRAVNSTKAIEENYTPPIVRVAMKKNLYYNGDQLCPYILCEFRTQKDMYRFRNLVEKFNYLTIDNKRITLESIEGEISMYQRMIASCNLQYAGWLRSENVIEVTGTGNAVTRVREFIVPYTSITVDTEMLAMTYPVLGAVDIETYTTLRRGFPNKVMQNDCIFMISLVVQRFMDSHENRVKIVYGLADCAPTDEFTYIKCVDEYDMITRLFSDIHTQGVTVLTGYNIFGYDFDYIYARLCVKGYPDYLAGPQFTLVKDGVLRFMRINLDTQVVKTDDMYVVNIEGIVGIDMLVVCKVEYSTLERHSLEFVSQHFLGCGKADISAEDMFDAFRAWLADTENPSEAVKQRIYDVAYYNMLDSDLCIRLMERLNMWTAMVEQSTIYNVRMSEIHLRGQQRRMLHKVHTECTKRGLIMDRVKFPRQELVGATVLDPQIGVYNNVMILDFNSLYPSIIIAYNICFSTCVAEGSPIAEVTPDEHCNVVEWTNDAGEQVRTRFLKAEIKQGILPQICSYYISERKNVRAIMRDTKDETLYRILDQRQNALKVSANSLYGVLGTSFGRLSLPPGAATITAVGRLSLLKAYTYARDVCGVDVIYGDTDSIMIRIPGMTNPEEIRAKGEEIAEQISSQFGDPLRMNFDEMLTVAFFISKKRYVGFKAWQASGDITVTDTNNALYNILTDANGNRFALLKECTTMSRVGIKLDDNDMFCKRQFYVKGVPLARRGNTAWFMEVYGTIMHMILHRYTRESVIEYIDESIRALLYCQVPPEMLKKRVKVKDKSTAMINKFCQRIRDRGVIFVADEIFDFLVHRGPWKTGSTPTPMGDRIEIDSYVIENLGVDRAYYVDTLTKAVDTILSIAYPIDAVDIDLETGALNSTAKYRPDPLKIGKKTVRRLYGCYDHTEYWGLWSKMVSRMRSVHEQLLATVKEVPAISIKRSRSPRASPRR